MAAILSIKTSCDKISKPLNKEAAKKALEASIKSALKIAKLELDPNAKTGFGLEAKIVSLTADNEDKPTKIEVKLTIKCSYLGGVTKLITLSNSAFTDGFNPNKPDAAAADVIDGVVAALLDKDSKGVKEMLKMP